MSLLSTIFDYAPHLELIGKFGGAVAVLYGAKKYVVSPLAAKIVHWKKWCIRLGKALDSVEKIAKEVYPNGGNSLRDRIDIIDARLSYIEARENVMMEDDDSGIFICDESGYNTFCNRTYARILGCSKEELLGQNWRNFMPERDSADYEFLWSNAFKSLREVKTDVCMTSVGGTNHCVHIAIFPLNKPTDKIRRFMGRVQINKDCAKSPTCPKAGSLCCKPASGAESV